MCANDAAQRLFLAKKQQLEETIESRVSQEVTRHLRNHKFSNFSRKENPSSTSTFEASKNGVDPNSTETFPSASCKKLSQTESPSVKIARSCKDACDFATHTLHANNIAGVAPHPEESQELNLKSAPSQSVNLDESSLLLAKRTQFETDSVTPHEPHPSKRHQMFSATDFVDAHEATTFKSQESAKSAALLEQICYHSINFHANSAWAAAKETQNELRFHVLHGLLNAKTYEFDNLELQDLQLVENPLACDSFLEHNCFVL